MRPPGRRGRVSASGEGPVVPGGRDPPLTQFAFFTDAFRRLAVRNLEATGDFLLVNHSRAALMQAGGANVAPTAKHLGAEDSSRSASGAADAAGYSGVERARIFEAVSFDVYRLHSTSDRTVAHLLRGALESADVPAIVEGEHLTPLQGEIPAGASAAFHVSIVDEEQLPRASIVMRRWLDAQSGATARHPWTCATCGETHEPQFHSCWQCGAERDTV